MQYTLAQCENTQHINKWLKKHIIETVGICLTLQDIIIRNKIIVHT